MPAPERQLTPIAAIALKSRQDRPRRSKTAVLLRVSIEIISPRRIGRMAVSRTRRREHRQYKRRACSSSSGNTTSNVYAEVLVAAAEAEAEAAAEAETGSSIHYHPIQPGPHRKNQPVRFSCDAPCYLCPRIPSSYPSICARSRPCPAGRMPPPVARPPPSYRPSQESPRGTLCNVSARRGRRQLRRTAQRAG